MKFLNRTIFLFTVILLSIGAVSCKSTKKETKEERKARKQAEWLAKRQKTDPYTGWIYIPEQNFSVTNGNIKISMRGDLGSFCLYAVPQVGGQVALLSTVDSFCTSSFYAQIENTEYRLTDNVAVSSQARRTPYGAQMAYTIANKAEIIVDFSFLPSEKESSFVDMIRVTMYAINISPSPERIAIKAIFDTVLGETAFSHFSTATRPSINAECQILDMKDDLWLRSSNTASSIQFLLSGKGISSPSAVTLSNKDYLAKGTWIPRVQPDRSFSSVLAYNNSALGLNWDGQTVDSLKSLVNVFYISVGTDGKIPAGENFLESLAEGKTALSEDVPEYAQTTDSDSLKNSENDENQAENTETFVKLDDSNSQNQNPSSKTISDVNSKYIQDLIDRINSLEDDGSDVNDEEIRLLNAELDSLMRFLRNE